jgi:hypothetical protein
MFAVSFIKCYKELRDSWFLLLPSQRTLQIYKNKINQKPGINIELIHWMKNEALSRNLPPDGYERGLILDEMSIQRDGNVYVRFATFSEMGEARSLSPAALCSTSGFDTTR